MAVNFYSEEIPLPSFKKNVFKKWINQVVVNEGCKVGEVSVVFVSDSYLLKINNQYLKHNYHTDIITFDYSVSGTKYRTIGGDLFISIDTLETNSKNYNVTFYKELCRVLIHGILHLIGFKDKTREEFDTMKQKEEDCLALLESMV